MRAIMKRINQNKKSLVVLLPLLCIVTVISLVSIMRPEFTTNEITANSAEIITSYDYQAKVKPSVLYPNGGTVEVGQTIFKQITTAIPFHLQSTIQSNRDVLVKGNYEVRLVVKAGGIWERTFPIVSSQPFEVKGTDIAIIDKNHQIDLEQVKSFITKVEEETGTRQSQYTLEVIPTIEGIISYEGKDKSLYRQDKLIFTYLSNELLLASDQNYSDRVSFLSTETITNNFFGLPLNIVRVSSTALAVLLLFITAAILREWLRTRVKTSISQVDKINKKYKNRVIPVSQKVNVEQKSILALYSFKSILQIADDKELSIFFYREKWNDNATYFLVDGDCMYSYETSKTSVNTTVEKETGSDDAIATG